MVKETRGENFINSFRGLRNLILKHKAISLVIVGIVAVSIVGSSMAAHNRRVDKDSPRETTRQDMKNRLQMGMMKGPIMNENIFPQNKGEMKMGENMPQHKKQQINQMRLYELFCQDGEMQNPEGFKGDFGPGAEKRGEGMLMVKNQVDRMVNKLQKEGYDTSNIEAQLQEINEMVKDFDAGVVGFQKSPEDFCARHTGWVEMNEKIKAIMTGILQEIETLGVN